MPVLEDPDRLLADGRLTLIIADEWGETLFPSDSALQHSAISPDEVLEWVKFVAIQCPECEAPKGEWRNL
ncbi:MAG TPA: hypothetical protein VMM83_06995 [Longimicrobiales bacterium]|nr:hypothetical protein [Longimicrobiales bacterium]